MSNEQTEKKDCSQKCCMDGGNKKCCKKEADKACCQKQCKCVDKKCCKEGKCSECDSCKKNGCCQQGGCCKKACCPVMKNLPLIALVVALGGVAFYYYQTNIKK